MRPLILFYGCSQFKAMSHEKRLAKERKHNLCLNCLRQGALARSITLSAKFSDNFQNQQYYSNAFLTSFRHSSGVVYASQCKSTRRCEECGAKHHFLLHYEKGKGEEDKAASETGKTQEEERVANYHTNGRHKCVLMMCQLVVRGPEGSATHASKSIARLGIGGLLYHGTTGTAASSSTSLSGSHGDLYWGIHGAITDERARQRKNHRHEPGW